MKNKNAFLAKAMNSGGFWSFVSSLLAILSGLLVGLVILLIADPSRALGGFVSILIGGFASMRDMGQVFYTATPIILTGLSVCFAYKTGLFNIGASGQFIMGAFAAVFVGVKFSFIPGPLLWLTCLLAAMLAGALWGIVPGVLNATRNVNIVIACIMMNYIGMYLVNLLIMETIFDSFRNQSMAVATHANAPKLGLDLIFRNGAAVSSVNAGIFVAIIAGIVLYYVIEKTKFGYELKACGFNRDAAKYAGINEKKSIVYSMAISGAVAGLGGACLYLAGAGKSIEVVDVLAAEGFQGIPVALLGMNHPIGVILSGIFIAYLEQGGFNMQSYGFAPQIIEIITSVIIYFSAFALVLRGVIKRYYTKKLADKAPVAVASGGENTAKAQSAETANETEDKNSKGGDEK